MPLNVLITGAAGYIGSHTTLEILNAGHTAICLDNGVNSYISGKESLPESLRRVCEITGKQLTFYEVDIRDRDQLNQVFKKVSILFNLRVKLFIQLVLVELEDEFRSLDIHFHQQYN